MNGTQEENRLAIQCFLHKARGFTQILQVAGVAIAAFTVIAVTYIWLFYNP